MSYKIIIGFCLFGAVLCELNTCNKAGMMCSDCDTEAVCIDMGGMGFRQVQNKCGVGSKCVNNTCTVGAKCNYRPFECSDIGSFPDPYDCKVHHICSINSTNGEYTDVKIPCFLGSYDSLSASCGFPMTTDACIDGPVPRCYAPLQLGALKSDPTIYYLCTDDGENVGPELYKCPGGRIFDETKISCIASTNSEEGITDINNSTSSPLYTNNSTTSPLYTNNSTTSPLYTNNSTTSPLYT